MKPHWLVTGVAPPAITTGGGLLRSRRIFEALAHRTAAVMVGRTGGRAIATTLLRRPSILGSQLAAAQLLSPRAWSVLRRLVRPAVLDLYDHPVLHLEGLGFELAPEHRAELDAGLQRMLADFRRVVVPTESYGDLCGVPPGQRIIVSNGTDTEWIKPGELPARPVVGMVSGAARGRGIEQLIEAVAIVRSRLPDTQLDMALVATNAVSEEYLGMLRSSASHLDWVTIREVPYPRLSEYLAGTTVLAIPHPPHPHMDAGLPLKLFDGMAAGRPVVVSPRVETARVVSDCGAGVVAASDEVDALAAGLEDILRDPGRARAIGERARACAVERFDWSVLSEQLADVVLGDR